MSRKIFISYRFTDAELVRTLPTRFRNEGGHCQGAPVFVSDPELIEENDIDDAILGSMQGCDGVLFVVGDDTHNSPWIAREIKIADSIPLDFAVVQLPYSTGGLPPGLASRDVEVVNWNGRALCDAINKLVDKRNRTR